MKKSLPFRSISFNPTSGLWYTLTGFFLLTRAFSCNPWFAGGASRCDCWRVLEAFVPHRTKIGVHKKTQPLPPSLLSPICQPYPHGIAPPAPGATSKKKPSCVSCVRWPAHVRSGRQSRRPSVIRRPLVICLPLILLPGSARSASFPKTRTPSARASRAALLVYMRNAHSVELW